MKHISFILDYFDSNKFLNLSRIISIVNTTKSSSKFMLELNSLNSFETIHLKLMISTTFAKMTSQVFV